MSITSSQSLNFVLEQALDNTQALLEEFLLSSDLENDLDFHQAESLTQNASFFPTAEVPSLLDIHDESDSNTVSKKLNSITLAQLLGKEAPVTLTFNEQQVELQANFGANSAFDLIGLTQLRNDPRFAGIDGSGVSVVIIDTGLDRTHPLLQPNYRAGFNFINNSDNPFDADSHGTHVSGTVGARDENIGVAPGVGLIGLRVFPDNGGASFTTIERALQWVEQNRQTYNIVAINMSLGYGFFTSSDQAASDGIVDEIRQLEQLGVTVVSAAGNSYDERQYPNLGAPAIYSTLAVGAVWQDGNSLGNYIGQQVAGADRITFFSQRLNAPNMIFAPGAMINSTVPGGGFDRYPGTSMASPHVAGAVALMQEAALQFGGRLLSTSEVVEIMRSTANTIFDGDDENDNVQNTNVNYPRLNVYNAISEIARRFGNTAPPPPGGGTGDANGTITGAILGPTLNGEPVSPLIESIGIDGTSTNIGNTDVDIYRFTVASPGNVTIQVGSNTSNPADFDSLLRLFDSSGNEIGFNDDLDSSNRFSRINTTFNPGTYYVGVSGYNNRSYNPNVAGSGVAGATGNYSLSFSLGNADPNGIVSGAVNVDLGNDREPLQLLEGFIGADRGQPVGTADVDLFELAVPDNGTLLIDIDTPFDADFVDSYLRVFEVGDDGQVRQAFFTDTGEAVVSDDDLADNEFLFGEEVFENNTFVGHRVDSYIAGEVERGDVYYIGVSDFENQDYDPNNLNNRSSSGPGGLYNLIVKFVNNDLNGSITQALTDATLPIIDRPGIIGADGDPQTGQLREVGNKDVDFRKIRSATTGILEVDVDSYSENFSDPVDGVLFIFDGNGGLIASIDDIDSFDPRLQLPIQANVDYFVATTGYGNDNFDPFALGSGSGGDTGEYIFNSRLIPLSQTALLTDNAANSGSVQTLALDTTVEGNINLDDAFVTGAADVDIYRFVPTFTGIVEIRVSSHFEFGADTFLRLFDRNGNELAVNDNASPATQGSLLRVNVAAGTEYLIGVNGASPQARDYNPITGVGAAPGSRGTYTIRLEPSVDPAQYGASHPDLIRNIGYNLDALVEHYRNFGRFEGRNPDNFDELRYISSNIDLLNFFGFDTGGATVHYIQYGFFEGRSLTAFDPGRYLASYGDLLNFYGNNPINASRHYIALGNREGRNPNLFDPARYLASYPSDLLTTFGYNPAAAQEHYLQFGFREGRNPYLFDPARYLASYPSDLLTTFGYNPAAAQEHYLQFGFSEGRNPYLFDSSRYIASHPDDLIGAFGYNPAVGLDHYLRHGFFEGRDPYRFDPARYLASHGDLIRAFNFTYNLEASSRHYIEFGAREGRATNLFDPQAYLNQYSDLKAFFGNNLAAATSHYIEFGFHEIELGLR